MTMRQNALLAMRSPPPLRRCPFVFADEAGTGKRSGCATQASMEGGPERAIMRQGRWRSTATVRCDIHSAASGRRTRRRGQGLTD